MRFDFHGVTVDIASSDAETLRFFAASFALQLEEKDAAPARASRGDEPADVRLAIEPDREASRATAPGSAPPLAKRRRRLFRTKDAVVTGSGSSQIFETPGRATVAYDFRTESGAVFGPDRDLALEKGYLLVTTRVGALLDRRGLHRVHAMGVARGEDALLCVLAMGGGKTTLALELMRGGAGSAPSTSSGRAPEHAGAIDAPRAPEQATAIDARADDWCLLSDDCPLIARDGRAWPLPIRPGVVQGTALPDVPAGLLTAFPRSRHGPKTLIDARHFAGRVAPLSRVRVIAFGARSDRARPTARRRTRLDGLVVLWEAGVMGRGLPELLEYSAPFSAAGAVALVRVRISRLFAMLAALRGAAIYELALCNDAVANAALVGGLLDAHRAAGAPARSDAGINATLVEESRP